MESVFHREPLVSVASRLAVPAALSLMLVGPVRAQEHEHGGAHGEALGRVGFPVSCNEEARTRFERAMALLHSFWWEEGDRAFRGVAVADTTCTRSRRRLRTRFSPIEVVGCVRSAHVPHANSRGTLWRAKLLILLVPATGFEPVTP